MKKIIIGITAPNSVDLLQGQLKYIKEHGFDVALLAPDDQRVTDFCLNEGIRHIPVNIRREISIVADLETLISLIKIFKKEKPSIINLGTPKISLLGMVAGFLTKVPYKIYTCRGFRFEHEKNFKKHILMQFEKLIGKIADRVFCISHSVKDLGIHLDLFPENKIYLIGKGSSNGVDLSKFNRSSLDPLDQELFKKKYNLENCFVFGFVGRLVDRKGINELYESFDAVYSLNKAVRLVVVGRPFWDQIENKKVIEKMNTHPGIIMCGFQPLEQVPLILSIMDVFLLPAHWEGFGNVLIQAAAMGLPILATDVTGVRDAVSNGYNGILVKDRDTIALTEKMLELVKDDYFRGQLAKNSLVWSQNFEPEKIWKGYLTLYNKSF